MILGLQIEMREFVLEFDKGLRCRYTTNGKPSVGQEHRPKIVWEGGDPTPDEFPQYKEWIHGVNQTLANEWKMNLMHVFMLSKTRHEVWAYEPGKQPIPVSGF